MRSFFAAICILVTAVVTPISAAETMTIVTVTTAQEAAEHTARMGVVGHCTRRRFGGYEGVGFSLVSPDDAVTKCCFWGKRPVREIGVARGRRGWFAVVWYD